MSEAPWEQVPGLSPRLYILKASQELSSEALVLPGFLKAAGMSLKGGVKLLF